MEEIKNMGNIEEEEQYELADRGSRLAAVVIDTLIVILPTLIYLFGRFKIDEIKEMSQAGLSLETVLMMVAGVMIYLAINGYLLVKKGQTIGKKFMDIKIVTEKNELPTIWESYFVRNLAFSIVGLLPFGTLVSIVDMLCIFRKDRRCLHDLLAGTKVVFVND